MSPKNRHPDKVCQICGATSELQPAVMVRPVIGELIRKATGNWNEKGWVCDRDLRKFRHVYVEDLLEEERGELTLIEREVLESLREHETISKNPEVDFESALTFGERLSDRIANFGGSWAFLIAFFLVIAAWIVVNSYLVMARPFDPYPFILLNLILSCLAAVQAPIIMMSQNRQEDRDRIRASNDYQVNLKAELEIRHLHQKLDHIMSKQWERLVEIQEVQLELIDELRKKGREKA
ncbi:DUF1003 domain-containing protein [bacterium]|nr:MAG: DUF1003 domain-containing protein [bacterium]